MTLPSECRKTIRSKADAEHFIEALHAADLVFHFDDDPAEIIYLGPERHHERLFTDEEADIVRKQVARLYRFKWGEFQCPIGYSLHLDGEWPLD